MITTYSIQKTSAQNVHYVQWPNLYITDRLSRYNHVENKDEEIRGMRLNINTISAVNNMLSIMYDL